MIQRVLRLISSLIGLVFLLMGLTFLLAPGRLMVQFGIFPSGNGGFSTMRGDIGALFMGVALFVFMGVISVSSRWLSIAASFVGMVAFGRVVSLLFDGYSSEGLQSLIAELVMAGILVTTAFSLRQGTSKRIGLMMPVVLVALLFGAAFLFQRPIGLALTKRAADRTFSTSFLASLPDGLHAGLCGSGSPLADPTRAGPCVFVIAGKRTYIVDAGEGSTRKLTLMGLPAGQIDTILLTHFHSDHIGGLGEMMLQRWASAGHKDPAPVIGPQGVDSVVNGFNDAYALDKKYRVAHHGEATLPPSGSGGVARPFTLVDGSDASQIVLQQDGLTITAFAVPHAPVFPAAAYRFDYQGRSIVVSGDTAPSQTLAKYAKGVDVLFHEGLQTALVSILQESAARNDRTIAAKILGDIPPYHTTPEDAARLAQQAGVKYLMFYHTIPPLPFSYMNAAFLGDAPKIFKGPITVGKDGMMLSLLPGGTTITLRELL